MITQTTVIKCDGCSFSETLSSGGNDPSRRPAGVAWLVTQAPDKATGVDRPHNFCSVKCVSNAVASAGGAAAGRPIPLEPRGTPA